LKNKNATCDPRFVTNTVALERLAEAACSLPTTFRAFAITALVDNAFGVSIVEPTLIKYGLVAVFVAAMLEADVVPILTGVAAHRGYFNPFLAIAVASVGALAGDCVWFYIGRHNVIKNSRLLQRIRSKAEILFRRVGHWQIPASHVVYGTRIATMTLLGARGSPVSRFVLVDGVSCLTLTTLLFYLGFALSASVSVVLRDVKRVELVLLVTVVLLGLIVHLLQRLLGRRIVNVAVTGEQRS
jgi:membrane protein DedA with SNARE-associated domain